MVAGTSLAALGEELDWMVKEIFERTGKEIWPVAIDRDILDTRQLCSRAIGLSGAQLLARGFESRMAI